MAHFEGKRYGCSCPDGTCDMNCRMYRIAAGKPSNADKIRQMTDEELAKTMHSTGDCPPCECPYAYADLSESGGNITDKQCVECWLDWLKQETKDG